MSGTVIYTLLIILATYGNYLLIWRSFVLLTTRLCDAMSLESLAADVKQNRRLSGTYLDLGWLKSIVARAEAGNLSCMRRDVEQFRDKIDRGHDTLMTVSNAAMGLGFLGTVAALARPVVGKVDPVLMIGLGMMTTLVGLMIALPGAFFHGITNRRVQRFLDQVDDILDALDSRPTAAAATAVVSLPVPQSVNTKHHAAHIHALPANIAAGKRQKSFREKMRVLQDQMASNNGEKSTRSTSLQPASGNGQRRAVRRPAQSDQKPAARRKEQTRERHHRDRHESADARAVDEVLGSTSIPAREFAQQVMHWIEGELDETTS